MSPHATLPGDWRKRRRVIYLALAFCAVGIGWAMVAPGDAVTAPVRGQVALALIAAASAIIGSYVFGAVWDDHNARLSPPSEPPS